MSATSVDSAPVMSIAAEFRLSAIQRHPPGEVIIDLLLGQFSRPGDALFKIAGKLVDPHQLVAQLDHHLAAYTRSVCSSLLDLAHGGGGFVAERPVRAPAPPRRQDPSASAAVFFAHAIVERCKGLRDSGFERCQSFPQPLLRAPLAKTPTFLGQPRKSTAQALQFGQRIVGLVGKAGAEACDSLIGSPRSRNGS